MSLKNNACGLTPHLTEEPCVQGTKPCIKRTPFFVQWCKEFGVYPRGSIVYTNCGFHFTLTNTSDNPSDPNGSWVSFSMGVLLEMLNASATSCSFQFPPGVSAGCRQPVAEGEIRCWEKGLACSLEDDNATAPKYTVDGDRDPTSKWSKVMSPTDIICSILEGSTGGYSVLKNKTISNDLSGGPVILTKDTPLGPVAGSAYCDTVDLGTVHPQTLIADVKSSYSYFFGADPAVFPPTKLGTEIRINGGAWVSLTDGGEDRVGGESGQGSVNYETSFVDRYAQEDLEGVVEVCVRNVLNVNNIKDTGQVLINKTETYLTYNEYK